MNWLIPLAVPQDDGISLSSFVIFSAIIGVLTAFFLYRAAQARKELHLDVPVSSKDSGLEGARPALREKIEKIAILSKDPQTAMNELSKIVEEETQERVKDIKQEYSVKYQVVLQEKNREVDSVKREFHSIKQKYQEVEKRYQKADSEKKTTEAVVRSIAEGLVVVNQKGEVLLMNPSAEKILGVQREKKVGQPLLEDVGDELMVSMSRPAVPGSDDKVVEYTSKNENVKKIIRSSSAVIQNEDGQTIGMVNILTDVTKQRELDEVKSKFVSNVTHELRTPIVAMQKAISILQTHAAGSLTENQANFVDIVSRNLAHLNRLVEDLLDIAKIDSGKMRIKAVPGRLDKAIHDACDMLDTWARSKNIQIIRNLDRNFPDIAFDAGKIVQVMNNLIGNAIKFTPSGGKITVQSSFSPDGRFVQVSVSDNGIGIAKENISKLFGRFQQFGDQQGIGGTGLGLSISKEIVERHGGQISAESHEGKGATLTFTLPIKQQRLTGG